MKRLLLPAVAFGLFLLFSASFGLITARARPLALQAGPQTTAQATISGFILKSGKDFIVDDIDDNDVSYRVDDPDKVSQYENKKVKVTGTVYHQNATMHVDSIEAVPWLLAPKD